MDHLLAMQRAHCRKSCRPSLPPTTLKKPWVVPFGVDTTLPVEELDPIGDASQQARAAQAIAALEAWLADGAWRAGPAGITVSYGRERTSLLFWLDDHGTYRSAYRVLDSGDVTDLAAAFSPSAFGYGRASPLVRGALYGLLVGLGLVALWELGPGTARLLFPRLRGGAS